MAEDDGYESGPTLPKREILPARNEKEEVGPFRRHIVKHDRPGHTGMSHYIATKMAIIGFMRGLANGVGSDGITANAVLPGLTNTAAIAPQSDEQKRATLGNSRQSNGLENHRM